MTGVTFDYKRILVPVDFSDPSRKAFYTALRYAEHFDAEVIALHIEGSMMTADGVESATEDLDRLEKGVQRRVDELIESGGLSSQLKERVAVEVRGGKPWEQIVGYAGEHGVDLIVMGSNGKAGLLGTLAPSACERVVRRAACHVLVVKPDGYEQDPVPARFRV